MERLNFYREGNLFTQVCSETKNVLLQINYAAKRLYNFAANRLHYAAKQLVAKRPDTI